MQQESEPTPSQRSAAQSEGSGARLPAIQQPVGDQQLFETAPELASFFDRGYLTEGTLPSGTVLQGYFVVSDHDSEPVLLWTENTSYRFTFPNNAADEFALSKGQPVRAVVAIEGNHISKNEEGFDFIHQQNFDARPLALEYAPLNPTVEQIAELPPFTGFIVQGEILSETPFAVRTEAGHELTFNDQTLPMFRNGVLEYETQQRMMPGDVVRFTAARSRELDQGVPVLHVPDGYQTSELLKPSSGRQAEYINQRVSRKLELIHALNAISSEQYSDAREILAELLDKPLTDLERGYVKERIEMMPEAERPVYANSSDFVSSKKASYLLQELKKASGRSVVEMNASEFSEFIESIATGRWQGVGGRAPQIQSLYYLMTQSGVSEEAAQEMLKTHVDSMIDLAREVGVDREGRYPDIDMSDSVNILAHSDRVESQMFVCDRLRDLVDSGEFLRNSDNRDKALFSVTWKLLESVHNVASQGKLSVEVLLAHEDTFQRGLAAVFPHEGYGTKHSLAGSFHELRKLSKIARLAFDLGEDSAMRELL